MREPIKTPSGSGPVPLATWSDAVEDDDDDNEGGILPFLVPLALAAGKAIAAGAVSGAAGYGVKKGLEAATRKKRVGKICWAQVQANQRLVRNMRNRWMKMAGVK